ncbi:hypothetical protein FM124_02595 [Pediococcus acidilactici]|nr:hypothetical protein FM124_02595 [Pediococcus acidilactici]
MRTNQAKGLITNLVIEPLAWLAAEDWGSMHVSTMLQRSTRIN